MIHLRLSNQVQRGKSLIGQSNHFFHGDGDQLWVAGPGLDQCFVFRDYEGNRAAPCRMLGVEQHGEYAA